MFVASVVLKKRIMAIEKREGGILHAISESSMRTRYESKTECILSGQAFALFLESPTNNISVSVLSLPASVLNHRHHEHQPGISAQPSFRSDTFHQRSWYPLVSGT